MHYQILLAIIEELSPLLTGARVDRIIPQRDGGLVLLARNRGRNYSLLLSPRRPWPLLHLVGRKPPSSGEPHPFLLQLRSRLVGARITSVALVNEDRVVEFRFAGPSSSFMLYFELTGSSANLFLTDGESRILASYHPVSFTGSSVRTLLPGACYAPPARHPAQSKAISGPWKAFDASSPNQSAEALSQRLEEDRLTASLRRELGVKMRAALARAERLRTALTADLRSAQQADQYRMMGDLILANLRKLKPGTAIAELEGYEGTKLSVPLDPSLPPAMNADRYFKKYKKARAGMPVIRERLERTETEIHGLQAILDAIEKADLDGLTHLRASVSGVDRKGREQGRGRKERKESLPGIRMIPYQGWEILIGRSASGNDHLTTRLARPDDLWLHAEGLPGSHVLVKNPSRAAIPPAVLEKAASLAAFYSKGKMETKVPVAYTQARYVKKPKGAKPGLVMMMERKTIVVKPKGGDGE